MIINNSNEDLMKMINSVFAARVQVVNKDQCTTFKPQFKKKCAKMAKGEECCVLLLWCQSSFDRKKTDTQMPWYLLLDCRRMKSLYEGYVTSSTVLIISTVLTIQYRVLRSEMCYFQTRQLLRMISTDTHRVF